MKKDMSLEGLRWSCNSGSALYDTPPNGRSRTGWGGNITILIMRINQLIVFRQPPSMLIKKVAVWLLTQALWGRL